MSHSGGRKMMHSDNYGEVQTEPTLPSTEAPTGKSWLEANESLDDYTMLAVILCLLVIAVICFICRKQITIWLYAHRLCIPWIPNRTYDSGKEYDAFVQFSPNEPSLIWEYVRELENGKRKFKFCYWKMEDTPDNTLKSMIASKEIIILMTKDYLQSEICRLNFNLAMQATSMDWHKQMIVIKYPDIGNIEEFGKYMKSYLDLCTCIERDDDQFWNKLLFTLPHHSKHDDNKLKEAPRNIEITTV